MVEVHVEQPPDLDRAKAILVEVVRAAGDQGILGLTRVYKAFYAVHVIYLRETGKMLSRWPIVHMPYGPGIDQGELLMLELERGKALAARIEEVGPYQASRYLLGPEADNIRIDEVDADAFRKAVTQAVRWVLSKTATDLSSQSHLDSRSWQSTQDGEPLSLPLDTLTDEEAAASEMRARAAAKDLADLFPLE